MKATTGNDTRRFGHDRAARAGFASLVIALSIASATAIMPRSTLAQSNSALVAAARPFVDRHELAGAVMLVADRDRVLALESVGLADREANSPMRGDSLFWIASQSKPITAAACMMLVDEGRVGLDDAVEKYLHEFHGQMVTVERDEEHLLSRRAARPITVRDVLSHTSGLPFKSALEEPTLDLFPLVARVRSYAMTPLDFEPGTDFQYSNAGINTAARIIEVVAGMPFEEFLNERLFKPLGMKDTTFWPTLEQVARLAKSYKAGPDDAGLVETPIAQLQYPLDDRESRYPMPAGGLFSTATDVSRFYQMLLNDGELNGRRYLSVAALQEMTRKQTPEGVKRAYGFGLNPVDDTFGHGGAYGTNTTADRATGLIYVWLVQHASFPGDGANAQDAFRKAAEAEFARATN